MFKQSFLIFFLLCNSMIYSSEKSNASVDNGFLDPIKKPVKSILLMAMLRNVFSDNTCGTMGQSSVFKSMLDRDYRKGESVIVHRGFGKDREGKIIGSITDTSQGRVTDAQSMMTTLKMHMPSLAMYASSVVPMEEIVKLVKGTEEEAVEGLTKYLAEHSDELMNPKHIYVIEGSDSLYHVSCLRAP